MKIAASVMIFLFFARTIIAQKTFTKHVASTIYNKCTTCHRPGEIGPFPLLSYEDVAERANIIRSVVSTDYMPPWQPDPTYNNFIGEYFLTDTEKANIIEWIDQGLEYGNSTEEPDLPDFPDGSLIGQPDLVLEFEEAFVHQGNNEDHYRYFVLPTGLTEDKIIKAIELRPGNSKIVHHALFFEDTEGIAASFDAQTPEYGFEGFGGFDNSQVINYDQYPGYVPGTKPIFYPDGLGQKLSANSDLVVQMHYAPWPVDETDKSSINIFFADEDEQVDRLVDDRIMLPFDLIDGAVSFFILPNQTKEFHGIWTLESDRSLIGLSPHMHFLGKSWEVWLERVDGSTENLIRINEWDFNWQGGYYFTEFIPAKQGDKIHAVAIYDNTLNNPQNPSVPPRFVSWGEGTTDEMYYLPILSVPYQDGDEDIIFSNPTSTEDLEENIKERLMVISPNPVADGYINVDFHLSQGAPVTISLFDFSGSLIRTFREGEFFSQGSHKFLINSSSLNSGQYIVSIRGKNYNNSASFIKR